MDLQTLFDECSRLGDFPSVEVKTPLRHSNLTVGKVVEINTRGIGVQFKDLKWVSWFGWNSQAKDTVGNSVGKRSHYADELSLKREQPVS